MAVDKGLGAGLVQYRANKKAGDAKKADVTEKVEVAKAPTKAKKAPAVKATVNAQK